MTTNVMKIHFELISIQFVTMHVCISSVSCDTIDLTFRIDRKSTIFEQFRTSTLRTSAKKQRDDCVRVCVCEFKVCAYVYLCMAWCVTFIVLFIVPTYFLLFVCVFVTFHRVDTQQIHIWVPLFLFLFQYISFLVHISLPVWCDITICSLPFIAI